MYQLTNREYEEYQRYLRDKHSGRILTSDGIRTICASYDYDPTQIGQHFLDLLPKVAPQPIPQPAPVSYGWEYWRESDGQAHCIEDLEVTVRAYNILRKAHIDTLEQLLDHTYNELRSLPGMGKVGLKSIMDGLERYGLSLKK